MAIWKTLHASQCTWAQTRGHPGADEGLKDGRAEPHEGNTQGQGREKRIAVRPQDASQVPCLHFGYHPQFLLWAVGYYGDGRM